MRRKFVYRLFCLFALIMLVGFLCLSIMIIQSNTKRMAQMQRNYEGELIQKRAEEINSKLLQIGNVFSKAYLYDENRKNVTGQIIEPNGGNESIINAYIREVMLGSNLIYDIIIVDNVNDRIFFQSKKLYDTRIQHGFLTDNDFVQRIMNTTDICIRVAYSESAGEDVISFGHKIRNMKALNDMNDYGYIIVDILARDLFPKKYIQEKSQAGVFIAIDDNDSLLWGDSSLEENNRAVKHYQKREAAGDKYDVSSLELVSWSGIRCVSVLDLGGIFKSNLNSVVRAAVPILAIVLALCLLVAVASTHFFSKRIKAILDYVDVLKSGHFGAEMKITGKDELADIERELNKISKRMKQYIEKEYITDIAIKKAQINSLQLQINPHFMFNTLECIRSSAAIRNDGITAKMISLLGQMYQWNMQHGDVVSLMDELDYMGIYIRLREMTLQCDIDLDVNVPRPYSVVSIPKLSIQPIVENSLSHGYADSKADISIRVAASLGNSGLVISVSDNGNGMNVEEIAALQRKIDAQKETENLYHIGLVNVNQRIKLLFGASYGLRVHPSCPESGLRVDICVPVKEASYV